MDMKLFDIILIYKLKNYIIMKKLFFIAFLLLQSFNLFAQVEINEFDLVGKWNLESYSGEFNYKSTMGTLDKGLGHPNIIELYTDENIKYSVGKIMSEGPDQPSGYYTSEILDYFITYGSTRILHFTPKPISSPTILRFRIIKYNGEELELATFDGKGSLLYKRESVANNIRSLSASKEYNGEVYSINGSKIGDNASKGIIIKDGKKIIAK